MIFDLQSLMSDQQAITANAASTNYIDFGAPGTPHGGAAALDSDVGKSMVPLTVQITEAFNLLTNLKIAFEVDDNTGFASAKEVWSQTIVLADLVVGKQVNIDYVPKGADEQYGRMYYTVSGVAPSTGKVTAGISMGNQTNQ